MLSRGGDAVAGALGDEPSLEVRDGAEDVEQELARGRRGIEVFLEADQMNARRHRRVCTQNEFLAIVEVINGAASSSDDGLLTKLVEKFFDVLF